MTSLAIEEILRTHPFLEPSQIPRFLAEIALQLAIFNERAAAQFAFDQERAAKDEEDRALDEEDRAKEEKRRVQALAQMEQLISVQGRLVTSLVPEHPGRPAIVVPMPDSVASMAPSDPAAAVADSSTAAHASRQNMEDSCK